MPEFADIVTLTRERYNELLADIDVQKKHIVKLEFTIQELVKDFRLKSRELERRRGEE